MWENSSQPVTTTDGAPPPNCGRRNPCRTGKNGGPTVVLPSLEARLEADNIWHVPLLPAAEEHALDAWRFTLKLAPLEWETLRPMARALTDR